MIVSQLKNMEKSSFLSSNMNENDPNKVIIYAKDGNWYYKYQDEISDFKTESVCIYTLLRKYHYYIDKYLPKYKMIQYGDFDIGVIFEVYDKYIIFFGEKANLIIESTNIDTAEDDFWTDVQKNKVYQSIIDDFEHINY